MQLVPTITCLLVLLALSQAKDYRKIGAEYVPAESGKASLDEPSCEELRAMWRFSKRQSRAAEITNEIPQYRDPFVYNIWEPYAGNGAGGIAGARSVDSGVGLRTKSVRPVTGRIQRPIYGRIVHTPPPGVASVRTMDNSAPMKMRAFDEVQRIFASGARTGSSSSTPRKTYRYSGLDSAIPVPQAGSFQQLKELVRAERARELQQRYADDQAALTEYGRIMHGPPPREESKFGSLRYGRFEEARPRGVIAFPDVLAPASRIDELVYMDPNYGFASAEDAYAQSAEMMQLPTEVDPVPAKAKHRSSITKGRRVYGSRNPSSVGVGISNGGAGSSSSSAYPLADSPQLPSCTEIVDVECTSSLDCACTLDVALPTATTTTAAAAESEGAEAMNFLYRCITPLSAEQAEPNANLNHTDTGRCHVLQLAATGKNQRLERFVTLGSPTRVANLLYRIERPDEKKNWLLIAVGFNVRSLNNQQCQLPIYFFSKHARTFSDVWKDELDVALTRKSATGIDFVIWNDLMMKALDIWIDGKRMRQKSGDDAFHHILIVYKCQIDEFGAWHAAPLESSHLGVWHRRKRSISWRRSRSPKSVPKSLVYVFETLAANSHLPYSTSSTAT
ncbi:hypothetical protein B566_EDAN010173 [Ephemera danica]|nr:hypothetical protein B566_EDAN010173 [Ephemera danica]